MELQLIVNKHINGHANCVLFRQFTFNLSRNIPEEVLEGGAGMRIVSSKRMWAVLVVLALSLAVASCDDHGNLIIPGTDTTAPTRASGTPAAGVTGVAITSTVTATFSEERDAATISGTRGPGGR